MSMIYSSKVKTKLVPWCTCFNDPCFNDPFDGISGVSLPGDLVGIIKQYVYQHSVACICRKLSSLMNNCTPKAEDKYINELLVFLFEYDVLDIMPLKFKIVTREKIRECMFKENFPLSQKSWRLLFPYEPLYQTENLSILFE
jgi:hypothetical protein